MASKSILFADDLLTESFLFSIYFYCNEQKIKF